ncbi:M15 family metallopeptidase [Weissella halotolerans]|uniref:M15B family D-Ala-D-Ala carboxypeptidase VanY n=1 Tax=Weissella halotolerans DSM 20190 TaxID=1123500 RepID=A0A0R2G6B8_9LACO|nr:M15 family metallopeptidase [Weissella halotolerans]KRN32285.1 M15B family D-Ala-D-Ala carboxypeptidase VanY [Weissella halotolerans DSM 20190]
MKQYSKRAGWVSLVVLLMLVMIGVGLSRQNQDQMKTDKVKQEAAYKSSKAESLPKTAQLDNPDLRLVNSHYPLKKELSFQKATYAGQTFDQRIQKPLMAFLQAARDVGYPATLVSGYRSIAYQKEVFARQEEQYLNQGDSEKEAYKKTRAYIQTPGASEHHTGLAVDIMTDSYWDRTHGLDSESDQEKGQQWLIRHAPDYGFVLRYPKSAAAVKQTGIAYESWHFRYVGLANAHYMAKHHLTLEEYVQQIKQAGQN